MARRVLVSPSLPEARTGNSAFDKFVREPLKRAFAELFEQIKYLITHVPDHDRTAAEISAGVTPTNYQYPPGDVRRYGVTGDGSTDDTAAFATAFSFGGDKFVPALTYRIAGAGADAGGVSVTVTQSMRISCEAGATFDTDSLDNDFFRFTVPSDGSGLPAEGIEFEWHGGFFDQRNQKNSIVIPFPDDYPGASVGSSSTCDAVSVRGDYTDGSTEFHGIKRAVVERVTCYAGDHWESAGGDAGVFVGGCAQQIVRNIRSVGSRDLAVYCSGSTLGTLDSDSHVENVHAVNCFGAVAIKRSSGARIVDSYAENCPRGFAVDWVDGAGADRVSLRGNRGKNCGIFIRMQLVSGFDVSDNHCLTLGALLEDGSTVEGVAGCNGIELYGCSKGVVRGNTVLGLQSGIAAAYPSDYMLFSLDSFTHDATTTACSNVLLMQNLGDGLRTAGADTGDANAYIENYVINAATSANVSFVGTNSFELRVNPATMFRSFMNPVGFSDGTASAPAVVRSAQPTLGIRFGTSLIGLCTAGADAIRVDNDSTAGNTRLMVFDVDSGLVRRVSVGAADSGGTGFKVLRIAN